MTAEAWIGLASLALIVLSQTVGLIWGALKLVATVKALSEVVGELKETVHDLRSLTGSLDTRVTVLEDRSERTGVGG